jgi:hypothetical protein
MLKIKSGLEYILITAALSTGTALAAESATVSVNQTDLIAVQFYGAGKNFAALFKTIPECTFSQSFSQVVEQTKVYSEKNVVDNGTEVPAKNYSDHLGSRIVVSRWQWISVGDTHKTLLTLVQYLEAAGISFENYQPCRDAIEAKKINFSGILPPIHPMGRQILQSITLGSAHLSCRVLESGIEVGKEYILRTVRVYPKPDSSIDIDVGHKGSESQIRWMLDQYLLDVGFYFNDNADIRLASLEWILSSRFPAQYDIETGKFQYKSNFLIFSDENWKEIPNGIEPLDLESEDALTWKMSILTNMSSLGLTQGQILRCKTKMGL